MLPNGQLLTDNGLHRQTGIYFRIDPALLAVLPQDTPSEAEVREALAFLLKEWLQTLRRTLVVNAPCSRWR